MDTTSNAGRRCAIAPATPAISSTTATITFRMACHYNLAEKSDQFRRQRGTELLDLRNLGRVPVNTRHIVADSDGRELNGRAGLNGSDDLVQMVVEIFEAVGCRRRFVHRRPVGDDDE